MNFEFELRLIVDDRELLFTLPMEGSQETALNTLNVGMIQHAKVFMRCMPWEQAFTRPVRRAE